MKNCITCQRLLPLANFYTHPRMKDGHLNKCIGCVTAYTEARRKKLESTNPEWVESELDRQRVKSATARAEGKHKPNPEAQSEWRKRNSHKSRAHDAVAKAMASGRLIAQPCYCGAPAEAHHEDYSKPLEIVWLCSKHHAERHVQIRREARQKSITNHKK